MHSDTGVNPKLNALLKAVGLVADQADRARLTARLPGMGAAFNAARLGDEMEDIRDQLRAAYAEASGIDPWKESDPDGDE